MRQPRWPVLLALILCLAMPSPAWARAGGGGGGFGGGGLGGGGGPHGAGGLPSGAVLLVIGPILAVGMLVVLAGPDLAGRYGQRRAVRREVATVRGLKAASGLDLAGYARLRDRVRECFFPVQESWRRSDMTGCRPYVSQALYERHRSRLEAMKRRGRANRIEDLVLSDVWVVRLHRAANGRPDRFVARIQASARDWVADQRRGVVVGGDPDVHRNFVEYWSFSNHLAYGWVVDEIRQRDWHLPRLPW